jgi:uncharacterized SAM-binding protein YcdF (DUF218 family)
LIRNQAYQFANTDIIEANVDLDYESKNTFQNVKETVTFIKNDSLIQNVLIISSDYHIMRIKFILNHLISDSSLKFYYDGLEVDYKNWDNLRKLLKESIKLTRTFFMLKILRRDVLEE